MVFAIDFLNERKSQGCPVQEDVYDIPFAMKMNVNSQNGLGGASKYFCVHVGLPSIIHETEILLSPTTNRIFM